MLRQGKFIVAFFVMAIFLGGPFIDSVVMADQVPLTDRCNLVSYTGGSGLGQFVTVVPGLGGPNDFPYEVDIPGVGKKYKWDYLLNFPAGSNSGIAILVPRCENPDIGIYTANQVYTVEPAGNPGSDIAGKTAFGVWTDHDNVIRIPTYNAITGSFFFLTDDKNPPRQISMQFKSGNNLYFCPGIVGPDCLLTVNPLVPSTPTQSITIPDVTDGITFKILRHPRSGQIVDVQVCGDPDYCGGECCSLETRNDVFGESIHNCTNLNGNQGYQECIIAGTGSPHTQNIVSGTITKVYAYCRTGEVKVPTANSFGFECYRNGVPHTD